MRNFLISIIILVMCISCEKYTVPYLPENPEWLDNRIEELDSTKQWGMKIDVYLWKEEYYYHFYAVYASCLFCNLYNYQGEQYYSWKEGEMDDFFEKGIFVATIWASPPYNK
jgi:hypothetical protein